MAQTPEQRKRNLRFAKEQTAKMGKPEGAIKKKDRVFKSPVSSIWLVLLGFVVFGGLLFELVSQIFF